MLIGSTQVLQGHCPLVPLFPSVVAIIQTGKERKGRAAKRGRGAVVEWKMVNAAERPGRGDLT